MNCETWFWYESWTLILVWIMKLDFGMNYKTWFSYNLWNLILVWIMKLDFGINSDCTPLKHVFQHLKIFINVSSVWIVPKKIVDLVQKQFIDSSRKEGNFSTTQETCLIQNISVLTVKCHFTSFLTFSNSLWQHSIKRFGAVIASRGARGSLS